MIAVVASWQLFLAHLTWPSSLHAAAYHYVVKGQPRAFTVMLTRQLRWSLLSVLGFLIGAIFWWWRDRPLLAVLFVVAGLAYPLVGVLANCSIMLGAQEKFVGLFWFQIARHLAGFSGFAFIALSVWWVSRVVTFHAANQVALALVYSGVTLWLVWRLRQSGAPAMSAADEREMVRYGKHQTGITLISQVRSYMDQLLVGLLMPLEVMADYSVAVLVYSQLKQLWSVYLGVRYPPLVRLPIEQRRRRLVIEGGVLWLGFAGIAIALSLLAYWLIPVLFPPDYASSLVYVNWLLATFVVAVPGFLATVYFRTEQDERHQYTMQIMSAAFGALLSSLLTIPFGVRGILAGRLLSNVLFSMVGLWLFWRVGSSKGRS